MRRKTVVIAILAALGVAVALLGLRPSKEPKSVSVGATAPSFLAVDARSGRQIGPADLKGKVVFVNFWASWCQPCKDEMPSIEALHRELLSDSNFVMVTILYRDSPADALGYMKAMGFSFPVFTEKENSISRDFGVTGVPETYLVDKKGVLRHRVIGGADWSAPEAKAAIQALLRE